MSGAPRDIYLGVDVGTSGCRACAIDGDAQVLAEHALPLPEPVREAQRCEQDPELWWQALQDVLGAIATRLPAPPRALALDATSATVLLCDGRGRALGPALMYNDARAQAQAERIKALAPPHSAAHGVSSSLSKLLWLLEQPKAGEAAHALHQADWLAARLGAPLGLSDENNALKLGYDPVKRCWPDWMAALEFDTGLLPRVLEPGTPAGRVKAGLASRLGLSPETRIMAGTTDSIAALIATGADTPGDAVSSLGSTLALKVISPRPVFAPEYGVYSHRLGDLWLAGGASNSGGAVLRRFFSRDELDALTPRLDPATATGLDYYPLSTPGERFPVADPALAPRLTPRPKDDVQFLQGLLEGIAAIEARGYARLHELGAPYPKRLYSLGGGAANRAWTAIRQALLGCEMLAPPHTQAAFGAACLARRGIMRAEPSLEPHA